jgi:hypothetical protein
MLVNGGTPFAISTRVHSLNTTGKILVARIAMALYNWSDMTGENDILRVKADIKTY